MRYKQIGQGDINKLVMQLVMILQQMGRDRIIERLDTSSHRDANFDFLDRIGGNGPIPKPDECWRIDVRFDPYLVARALLEKYDLNVGSMPPGVNPSATASAEVWTDDEEEINEPAGIIRLPGEREE